MRPEERDAAHLWDMLRAAREAHRFASEVSAHSFATDRMRQLAVERAVEIIGEAANRVSEACRSRHPEIPWRSIIAQRNVLAHEYGEIRQERMHALATTRLVELIAQLERVVPPAPEAPPAG